MFGFANHIHTCTTYQTVNTEPNNCICTIEYPIRYKHLIKNNYISKIKKISQCPRISELVQHITCYLKQGGLLQSTWQGTGLLKHLRTFQSYALIFYPNNSQTIDHIIKVKTAVSTIRTTRTTYITYTVLMDLTKGLIFYSRFKCERLFVLRQCFSKTVPCWFGLENHDTCPSSNVLFTEPPSRFRWWRDT